MTVAVAEFAGKSSEIGDEHLPCNLTVCAAFYKSIRKVLNEQKAAKHYLS